MRELTKEWILKAENDYLVAVREFKADPVVSDAVCFHSQQCIEKYMKALLQEHDVVFEKIHDLEILLQRCGNLLPELEHFRDELIKLSTFAVDVRYPGPEVSLEEAGECVRIMQDVRKVLRSRFGLP